MLIAVMSDSHDHIWNLRRALEKIKLNQAQMIIHCGDFVAPFMLKELETFAIPVHGVFGNNDGDQFLLTQLSYELKHIKLHGITGELDIHGYKIGFAHERVKAQGLLYQHDFHLVCYGHSHQYEQVQIDPNTILLNPGEIMGKDGPAGFCMVDTQTKTCERVLLDSKL
ncbi:MAG: YfcE family phosphodiesterase [Desulfobacterales bacterium]|nr:YfcE family phosphodiesterase [Desulfobacterales bacterium]